MKYSKFPQHPGEQDYNPPPLNQPLFWMLETLFCPKQSLQPNLFVTITNTVSQSERQCYYQLWLHPSLPLIAGPSSILTGESEVHHHKANIRWIRTTFTRFLFECGHWLCHEEDNALMLSYSNTPLLYFLFKSMRCIHIIISYVSSCRHCWRFISLRWTSSIRLYSNRPAIFKRVNK
jgi:hypothetical protein